MMRCCDDCAEWSQWLARSPIRGIDPTDKDKQRVIITGWKHVGHFCGKHKLQMETAPQELEIHFSFIGAATLGRHSA